MNLYLKSYAILPPFYPIFACVDPYSEYGSKTDPDPRHWLCVGGEEGGRQAGEE